MQNQKNQLESIKLSEIIDCVNGFTHAIIIPLSLGYYIQLWAILYYIIPITLYLTVAKHRESKIWFSVFLGILVLTVMAGWVDQVPVVSKPYNYYG